MKRQLLSLVLTFLSLALPIITDAQTSAAMKAMQHDYPGLISLYGDRIAEQKAHYIFVVDVSSSMLPYEATVKQNFLQFLAAVPDGDQVSLIKMSDENHTGFVGLLKCTELSPGVRQSIQQVINGFHFNQHGSPYDGSDGFTMAKTVLDALNTVGSNDLTFVYMLTDFEYWTHQYKYAKTKENWASLQSQIPSSKMSGMCKYGIELNSGSALVQSAIFKEELDAIFGKVEYQSVGSAALLSQWFAHISSNVMAMKLSSLVKADWQEVKASVKTDVEASGDKLAFKLDAAKTPLVNGAVVTVRTGNNRFIPKESQGDFPGSVRIGQLVLPATEKGFLPGFTTLGGDDYEADVTLQSPYADEISRLQGVCGEVAGQGDAVNLKFTTSGKLPSSLVWNSWLPIWVWVLIVLILLVIAASFVYEYAFIKLNREWSVSVRAAAPDGTNARFNEDGLTAPFVFGPSGSALEVNGALWAIELYTQRYNPLLFKKKSGYYLRLTQGSFANVETEYNVTTVSVGESVYLCGPGKATAVNIRIKEKGKTDYKISLD